MANVRPDEKVEAWKDPKAQPYVRIEKVTKKFGDFVAVDDVSLNIYKGEIFCLLGASGCGKTTLLRMLAGFEVPTAGHLWIDGVDMTGIPPYERPVNMMFQSYALFPHMTVEQNVSFGLKQDGIPKAELTERVAAMLELARTLGAHPFERVQQAFGVVRALGVTRHLGAQRAIGMRVGRVTLHLDGHAIFHRGQQGAGVRAVMWAGTLDGQRAGIRVGLAVCHGQTRSVWWRTL